MTSMAAPIIIFSSKCDTLQDNLTRCKSFNCRDHISYSEFYYLRYWTGVGVKWSKKINITQLISYLNADIEPIEIFSNSRSDYYKIQWLRKMREIHEEFATYSP